MSQAASKHAWGYMQTDEDGKSGGKAEHPLRHIQRRMLGSHSPS